MVCDAPPVIAAPPLIPVISLARFCRAGRPSPTPDPPVVAPRIQLPAARDREALVVARRDRNDVAEARDLGGNRHGSWRWADQSELTIAAGTPRVHLPVGS